MPRQRPEDKLPFIEKATRWLDTSGHLLEMRVAQAFRDEAFGVAQAQYYTDPTTRKLREIDVLCWRGFQSGSIDMTFFVSVECKNSRGAWIALSSRDPRFDQKLWVTEHPATSEGVGVLLNAISKGAAGVALFAPRDVAAYGVVEAMAAKNAGRRPFQALAQATTAAEAQVARFSGYGSTRAVVAFPVVVVTGPLYTAVLEPGGEISLMPEESVRVLWRRRGSSTGFTVVRIVRAQHVAELATSCRAAIGALVDAV